MVQYRRVGEILLEKGIINKRQLAKAIKLQGQTSMRFGEILTAMGAASEEDITLCLADQYDYPIADLAAVAPEKEAVDLLDQGFAVSHLVLPVKVTDEAFECVVSDPVDVATTDLIALNTHKRPQLSLAPPTQLLTAILVAYGQPPLVVHPQKTLPTAGTPSPAGRATKNKIDAQRDREALLAVLATLPQPNAHRSLWSRLVGRNGEA
jgi:hypothetical protein